MSFQITNRWIYCGYMVIPDYEGAPKYHKFTCAPCNKGVTTFQINNEEFTAYCSVCTNFLRIDKTLLFALDI